MSAKTKLTILQGTGSVFLLIGAFGRFYILDAWMGLAFVIVGAALTVWASVLAVKAQKSGEIPIPLPYHSRRRFWWMLLMLSIISFGLPFLMGYLDPQVLKFSLGLKFGIGAATFAICGGALTFGFWLSKRYRPPQG